MMYRKHFLSIFMLVIVFGLFTPPLAMAQTWQWGVRGNGNYTYNRGDKVHGMATDPNGNIYIATDIKQAQSNGDVAGYPVTGLSPISGGHDVTVLSSFNCNGSLRWLLPLYGTFLAGYPLHRINGGCTIIDVRADSLGGIYLLIITDDRQGGETTLSATTGDTVIQNHGNHQLLVKYDTSGQLKWTKWIVDSFNGLAPGRQSGFRKMEVSPDGNLYLLGYLNPNTYHNSAFPLSDSGYYLMKYDKMGICLGGTHLDITGTVRTFLFFSMDFKRQRYYFTGMYDTYAHPYLRFGNTQITHGGFISCMDAQGSVLWVKQTEPTIPNIDGAILAPTAIDNKGNVYIVGDCGRGCEWDGHELMNWSIGGSGTPFIVAMDSSGNTLWTTKNSSDVHSEGNGINVNNGLIIATGFGGDIKWGQQIIHDNGNNQIILPQLSKTTGQLVNFDVLQGSGNNNYSTGSIVSKEGAVFAAGTFDDALYVAGDTLVSRGGAAGEDWFLAKFATDCHCPAPQADFAVRLANNQAHFNYTGSGQIDSLRWRFGDSTTATGQSVTHTYADTGTYAVCVVAYNSCGQNAYCQYVTVAPNTGIHHFAGFHNLTAYPNPTHQDLHLTGFRGKLHYQVIGRLGRTLRHGVLQVGQADIDLSGLAPGLYFLKVQNEQGKVGRMKVVKE